MTHSSAEAFPQGTSVAGWERLAGLATICRKSEGRRDFVIALIDGPVFREHDCLAEARVIGSPSGRDCARPTLEMSHATFAASMLVGRGASVLGLCSGCTLLSIPIVDPQLLSPGFPINEAALRMAAAIRHAVILGAGVIQVGLEFTPGALAAWRPAVDAIEAAATAGVRTVMAAGNGGGFSPAPLLGCQGVVPVVAADRNGLPHPSSTLGPVIGVRGLMAPGVDIPGPRLPVGSTLRSGSSFAASFVTAAFALLHALLPRRTSDEIWAALVSRAGTWRTVVPRNLDGDAAFECLSQRERIRPNDN